MNEIMVVVGPAGMEREAIQRSVELTGEFTAVAVSTHRELTRRKLDMSRITCILEMYDAKTNSSAGKFTGRLSVPRMLVETREAPDSWLIEGLRSGAVAVIAWPCPANELRATLKAARQGEAYLTPKAGGLLVTGMRNGRPPRLWELVLTPRERQVARQLGAGRTNKEIAKALRVAESTVECHVTNIYRKLRVHSRAEAAVRINQKPKAPPSAGPLTDGEQQVVAAILQGHGNDTIADRLQISRHTVETHLTHAYPKLGVRSRTELIAHQAESARK